MKLLYSPSSPYARKVAVVAKLKNLPLTLETMGANPTERNEALYRQNPLGKIPCLIDGERAIYDSCVITDYIDQRAGPSLHDVKGYDRFHSKTLEALADGLLDAALLARYETFARPQSLRWPEWLEGQMGKIVSAVSEMERNWLPYLRAGDSIGAVAAGCALGYLNFRFPELNWRQKVPALAEWFDIFSMTAPMKDTAPPAA